MGVLKELPVYELIHVTYEVMGVGGNDSCDKQNIRSNFCNALGSNLFCFENYTYTPPGGECHYIIVEPTDQVVAWNEQAPWHLSQCCLQFFEWFSVERHQRSYAICFAHYLIPLNRPNSGRTFIQYLWVSPSLTGSSLNTRKQIRCFCGEPLQGRPQFSRSHTLLYVGFTAHR